jgi:hypothetical protein
MKFLLDTDHISILQRASDTDYAGLITQLSTVDPDNIAFLHRELA